jgi:hypothetical protein
MRSSGEDRRLNTCSIKLGREKQLFGHVTGGGGRRGRRGKTMVTWSGKGRSLDMKEIAVISRYEVESFILTEEVYRRSYWWI